MKKLLTPFLVLFSFFALTIAPFTYADNVMTFSGYLNDGGGNLISDGVFEFKVTLWNDRDAESETGEQANWEEAHPVIFTVADAGHFSIEVGSQTSISSTILALYPYLQIEVRDLGAGGEYEMLDPQPNNNAVDRLDFIGDTVFFSNNVFTIQQSNQLNNEISIQFGDSLEAFIKYNTIDNVFNISKSLIIDGDLTVNGLINGRDITADGAMLDGLSSAENIVNAINNSEFQISANNIDFSDLENAIYSYTFDLNEAEDFSYEGEDLILLENGEIKVAEDGFISVFAKYSDGEKIAYKPIDGIYSPADDLLYIASYSGARVYGVDPDTKQIVHEIGMNGYGNGGISNAYHVDVTEDGLMMAVTSSSHFVSVWKRASLEDSWHFEFDLGTPNSYGNVSDGSKFRSTYSAVIRNSDEHIFVGSYYGITADFNANSTGYGGVVEFDSDGNFVDIPLHIGSKGGNGTILQGEARYVYGLAFDENENLWVSTNDNQIGRFDSSTWELQKTITSNEVTGDYINSPYKIEILNEGTLAIRNNQTHQMQIWSVDGQLLRSVGYAEYSDSALAFVTLFGFLTDPEGDLYVMNYTNDNIQKINYSKVGTNSRLIFPIITLETAQRLERLLLNKKQIGSFNNISFQYRLDEGDGWEDMPEDYDLSDVDFGDNQIQISAVFEPELQSNATYSSDIIDSVQIEYSVIE